MNRSVYCYRPMELKFNINIFLLIIIFLLISGCGIIRRAAVKQIGDTLSSEKTMAVLSSDNDPDLVWEAMPFALKTMEVMLAQDPLNDNLQLALASGYIQYTYGHLAWKARITEDIDYNKSRHLWNRVYNLSLRGRDYALSELDYRYPDFSKKVRIDTKSTLAKTSKEDVPLLYWAAAGWAGAISANKSDMENMAELPVAVAMMRRVLELDENYRDGAVHEFFIAYETGQPNANNENMKKAEMHFKKVIEYTKGKKAYPYVLFAESVAVKKQDLSLFKKLLNQALAVNVNEVKKWRLVNTIAQEQARWLQGRIPILFLDYKKDEYDR